jgi:hypothetical protein
LLLVGAVVLVETMLFAAITRVHWAPIRAPV